MRWESVLIYWLSWIRLELCWVTGMLPVSMSSSELSWLIDSFFVVRLEEGTLEDVPGLDPDAALDATARSFNGSGVGYLMPM